MGLPGAVVLDGLGVAEFLSGNILTALRAYERARSLAPSEADTYVNIASVHARLGDRSEADHLLLGFADPGNERRSDDALMVNEERDALLSQFDH